MRRVDLMVHPAAFHAENEIEVRTATVTEIDRATRQVHDLVPGGGS